MKKRFIGQERQHARHRSPARCRRRRPRTPPPSGKPSRGSAMWSGSSARARPRRRRRRRASTRGTPADRAPGRRPIAGAARRVALRSEPVTKWMPMPSARRTSSCGSERRNSSRKEAAARAADDDLRDVLETREAQDLGRRCRCRPASWSRRQAASASFIAASTWRRAASFRLLAGSFHVDGDPRRIHQVGQALGRAHDLRARRRRARRRQGCARPPAMAPRSPAPACAR